MDKLLFVGLSIALLGLSTPDSSVTLPELYFEKNSVDYNELAIVHRNHSDLPNQVSDSVLYALYFILQDTFDIQLLEVRGNASFDEQNPEKLSYMRAQKVVRELINMGVDSNKLIPKGFGIEYLVIEPRYFEKLTSEEIIEAHNVNQRVSFRVLSKFKKYY